jgi:hypothetical protein
MKSLRVARCELILFRQKHSGGLVVGIWKLIVDSREVMAREWLIVAVS